MSTRTTTRSLKIELTEEEVLSCSRQMAQNVADLARLQGTAKEVAADYKGRIKKLNGTINEESQVVRQGFEYRNVECRERMNDPSRGLKTVIRTDTGEKVGIENMTEEDAQMSLFED